MLDVSTGLDDKLIPQSPNPIRSTTSNDVFKLHCLLTFPLRQMRTKSPSGLHVIPMSEDPTRYFLEFCVDWEGTVRAFVEEALGVLIDHQVFFIIHAFELPFTLCV